MNSFRESLVDIESVSVARTRYEGLLLCFILGDFQFPATTFFGA